MIVYRSHSGHDGRFATTDEVLENHRLTVQIFEIISDFMIDEDDIFIETYEGLLCFSVNCSDLFHWGSADREDVTLENVDNFRAAASAIVGLGHGLVRYAPSLFAARSKGMRPQGAVYNHLPRVLWPLFDACGPKRERDIHNPDPQPKNPEVIR